MNTVVGALVFAAVVGLIAFACGQPGLPAAITGGVGWLLGRTMRR